MSTLTKCFMLMLLLIITPLGNAPSTIDASDDLNLPGSQLWSKTYGGTSDEWFFSVIQTNDNCYTNAGYTNSSGAGNVDFWLVKTDSFGNQLWNKTYGEMADEWISIVVQTSDGGYALAGSTYCLGGSGYDFWLVKTDASGNQQWNKTYGGTHHDYAASIVQTSDGGYALAGITNSFGAGNADVWLIKTDISGNQVWNKTYGGANDDGAFSLVQTNDGGYAMTGNTYSFGAGGTDYWLLKTDSSGKQLWNKTFGGAKDDFGYFAIQTSDGGYALMGITNSSGAGYEDVWLVKTDSLGNLLWSQTYGGPLNDEAYFLLQTEDGGYAIPGTTYSDADGWDAWLIRTDASGNMLWNQTYGGIGDDQATCLFQTSDDAYALSGSTDSFGVGGWDAWLFKVSSPATPSSTPPDSNFSLNPYFLVAIGCAGVAFVVAPLSLAVYRRKRRRCVPLFKS